MASSGDRLLISPDGLLSLWDVMESFRCVSRIVRRFSILPILYHPFFFFFFFLAFSFFLSSAPGGHRLAHSTFFYHVFPPTYASVRGQQTRRHKQGEYERECRRWRKRRGRVFSIPGTLVRIWICIDWLVIASYFCAASIVPGYLSSRQALFKRDNEAFSAYRLLFIYRSYPPFRQGPPCFHGIINLRVYVRELREILYLYANERSLRRKPSQNIAPLNIAREQAGA